jgi:hypothetical protein
MERVDAIVVGGNMRGLVAAYVLGSLGCRTVLVEKGRSVGGADGSFQTPHGTRFDLGFHVLDYMRSPLATRLFQRVVAGEVHRTTLRRAIVLRNHVIPYAPARDELPGEIRALLPPGELHDTVGDAAPTRENLARCYGRPFVDLVFDEVLPSYPSENRHRAFGVDESQLLANIYPWFFPRAHRTGVSHDESRRFHDRLRAGIAQDVLYPKAGGFSGFALGFQRELERLGVELLLGADVAFERASGTHTLTEARANGRRLSAEHYFWAAPWGALCRLLDIPCQDTATDRVFLGSFRLDQPAFSDYHEILVGDPKLQLNRIHFPARFRASDEPLMQVEFAVPAREDWPTTAAHWGARWRADLERLGVLGRHRIEEFDFKAIVMHYNGYGMEGERLRDADPALLRADSNVRPVVPSMANLNLNRYVPRAVAYVASVLGAAEAAL